MKLKSSFLLLLTCFLFSTSGFAQDINGKWNAVVASPAGDLNLVFDLMADGNELSGSMTMDMVGTTPITDGTINGNEFSFKLTLPAGPGGQTMTINYDGTVEGDTLDMISTFEGQVPPGAEAETEVTATRA